MLGAIGGFSGWLWTMGVTAPAAILFAGAVALVAAAYLAGSRQDIDGTTEVAALVVLAAGVLAGIGSLRLASGIIALYPRVLLATAILNRAVVPPLAPYLAAPAVVAALMAALGVRRNASDGAPEVLGRNPLQLAAALQMAILFQAVLMAVHVAREVWGQSGIFTSAAVLGLTDVDALTVSMAREVAQATTPGVAATAVAVGVLANTAMKLGLALIFGSPGFKAIAGGALALMLLTIGAALVVIS